MVELWTHPAIERTGLVTLHQKLYASFRSRLLQAGICEGAVGQPVVLPRLNAQRTVHFGTLFHPAPEQEKRLQCSEHGAVAKEYAWRA
jgi:hypothetical protein